MGYEQVVVKRDVCFCETCQSSINVTPSFETESVTVEYVTTNIVGHGWTFVYDGDKRYFRNMRTYCKDCSSKMFLKNMLKTQVVC